MKMRRRGLAMRTVQLSLLAIAMSQSLGAQIPKDKAWEVLQNGSQDKSAQTRAIALRSLGLVPSDARAEKLAVDSLKDPISEVRVSAASALGKMGAKNSVPALKEALKDKDVSVILAAANSLRLLGDPTSFLVFYAVLTGERKSGEGLVAEQKKALSDPKKMAQVGFEQGIGFIPFAGIGYSALKTLTKDDVSPVRAAAAVALAKDPDPKSGQALVEASKDKSWIVRAAALDAIAQRNEPSLVPDIMEALIDSRPEVKYTAAAAVYHLSSLPAGRGH